MQFKANIQPIVQGLELTIIPSNITKFYQKSCIVELTIEQTLLRINTEASSIKSELLVKGQVSGEGLNHIFVDSLLFKNLLKSFDSDIVKFDIRDDGLIVYSGKSKFTLPQVADSSMELNRPQSLASTGSYQELDSAGWDFIKNQQMYAIAMSFIHPVYTNVWVGESGDVIVGDFDNSVFTHSNSVQLNSTCLLTDTIVNLLTTVPEDSEIINLGKSYELKVETDPYTYLCEFDPKYEEDPGVGDYSSDIILSLFQKPENAIKLNLDKVSKYLSQAELFANTVDDTIDLKLTKNESENTSNFSLVNKNVHCDISVNNPFEDFTITFKINLLKDVLMHMDSPDVYICPLIQDGEASGIIVWTENMEAMLAGVEV